MKKLTVKFDAKRKAAGFHPWFLDLRSIGQGRRYFATQALAEGECINVNGQVKDTGAAFAALPEDDRNNLVRLWNEVTAAGLTLEGIWKSYRKHQSRITDLNSLRPCGYAEAAAKFLASRQTMNCSHRHINACRALFALFGKAMGVQYGTNEASGELICTKDRPILELDAELVSGWFEARKNLSRKTRLGERARIRALFNFAKDDLRAIQDVPTDDVIFAKEDRKKLPDVITVEEAALSLHLLAGLDDKKPLVYWVIAMFGGLRPQSIHNVTGNCVDWEGKRVMSWGKTRVEYYAPLPDCAMEWLKFAGVDKMSAHEKVAASENQIARLRQKLISPALGRTLCQDILRHSTASYRNVFVSKQTVADELNNSVAILKSHYLNPRTLAQGQAFYALTPTKVAAMMADKIVPMQKAA